MGRVLGRAPVRLAVTLLVTGLVGLMSPAVARAEGEATISSLRSSQGVVTGTLTVRSAGTSAAVVDTARLSARVGNAPVEVKTKPIAQGRRAVMLVVDTSGSMGEAGMETAREAVATFLRETPTDVLVGLVSFASTAGVDVPPTKDRARVQKAVNGLRSRGETTLYDGISVAVTALGENGDRSIVLLSDGGDTRSTKSTRASATAALKSAGVRAEVIAFKTAESDNTVLRGFAAAGGGSVAAAGDRAAVRSAFTAAAKALDSQVSFSLTVPGDVRSKQQVLVSGFASGRPFSAVAEVDFGAAPVPSTTPQPTPTESAVGPPEGAAVQGFSGPGGLTAQLLIAMALTGLGALGLVLAFMASSLKSGRSRRIETIERYVSPDTAVITDKSAPVTPSAISSGLINIGDKVMEGRESTSKTMMLIDRADLSLRPGEWWVLRLVAIVAGVAIAMLLFRGGLVMTLVAVVLGAAVGYVLPAFVLRFLAKRRSKKFESQLPDILTLVASSLTSGFSLLQALDAVAKDAAEPAAKEFARALAETRIGSDVSDALDKMSVRMDSANMRWTTMAIRIQREVGGNLAETLRTTAKTLREREELHRHVRALSAEGRLSGYILIGLPIGIFLFTMQTNRAYLELLWTRPMGWMLMGAGVISMTIGTFWMRKVVDVQV